MSPRAARTIRGNLRKCLSCIGPVSTSPQLMLVMALSVWMMTTSAGQQRSEKTVEAERFLLRGQDGTRCAELVCENGGVTQSFFDKHGKRRIVIGTGDNVDAAFEIFDADGRIRLRIGLDPDGEVNIAEFSGVVEGRTATYLHAGKDGASGISIFDGKGDERLGLSVAPNNSAGVTIYDAQKKVVFQKP
jgi:hypothetical protein